MKYILLLLLFINSVFSSEVKEFNWPKGDSFLIFLEKHNIPKSLYFNQAKEEKELCSEINAGIKYQIMFDNNQNIKQILIPVSEDIQLHIIKENETYVLEIKPIEVSTITQTIALKIKYSPYQDIIDNTSNKLLANEFLRAYQKSVDFTGIQKGDNLIIKYTQKIRMGEYFGLPTIEAALIEVNRRKRFIFKNNKDDRYYNDKGKSLTSYFFKIPLRYSRISSGFTKKRWHPVLKRYRAHLGTDFAAPRGRNIYASADGRITYRGRKGGYGNVIEIQHKNGFKTLYAHMKKFRSGLRRGSRVKQGTLIGYVGSTGVSSGPHLHFGLYKNGRARDALKVVRVTKTALKGKAKRTFIANTKVMSKQLLETIGSDNQQILNLKDIDNKSLLKI